MKLTHVYSFWTNIQEIPIKLYENSTNDLFADPASINKWTQGRGLHIRSDSHFVKNS